MQPFKRKKEHKVIIEDPKQMPQQPQIPAVKVS